MGAKKKFLAFCGCVLFMGACLILFAEVFGKGGKMDLFVLFNAGQKPEAMDDTEKISETEKIPDFRYALKSDGSIEITGCRNRMKYDYEVTIPKEFDGYTVTSIGDGALSGFNQMKSLYLPSSLKAIGENAFSRCVALERVALPDSLISIGDDAFSYCQSLWRVTLGNEVSEIGEGAFKGCRELAWVNLPQSVQQIGENSFGYGSEQCDICVEQGSYAQTYCEEHGLAWYVEDPYGHVFITDIINTIQNALKNNDYGEFYAIMTQTGMEEAEISEIFTSLRDAVAAKAGRIADVYVRNANDAFGNNASYLFHLFGLPYDGFSERVSGEKHNYYMWNSYAIPTEQELYASMNSKLSVLYEFVYYYVSPERDRVITTAPLVFILAHEPNSLADRWKIVDNTIISRYQYYLTKCPEKMQEAVKDGRNCRFTRRNQMWLNSDHIFLLMNDLYPAAIWQNADGSVDAVIVCNNGVVKSRSLQSLHLMIEDEKYGTILNAGSQVDLTVGDLSVARWIVHIDADQVRTGKQEWTDQMTIKVDEDWIGEDTLIVEPYPDDTDQ